MQFLNKLIKQSSEINSSQKQIDKTDKVVNVEFAGQKISEYIFYVTKMVIHENCLYENGVINNLHVGIYDTNNKKSYHADVHFNKCTPFDNVNPDVFDDMSIIVNSAPNGPRDCKLQEITDFELQEYLNHMTRGYLNKHLDGVLTNLININESERINEVNCDYFHPDYN